MIRWLQHPIITRLGGSTIALALFTGLLLLGIAVSQNSVVIFGIGIIYLIAGGAGWQWRQRATGDDPSAHAAARDGTVITGDPNSEMALRLGVTVDGLVRATHAINDVTTQQSESAAEQAEVITLANNALDDYLALTERISEQIRNVTRTAEQAAEISQTGQQAINQSIESMDDIREQVEAIGHTIVTLAKLTQRIDEIITSVSEIATQSNLLALNASIEAARAGVHGRGFAVVADEVRSLAQQSTQSAAQVRSILIEIQQAMKDTVQATQTGIENVDVGVARTREADTVMVQLAESVLASREAVRDIHKAIQQQAEGMEEIAISVDRIERITQQNITSMRMVETVSANLTRLAADLQSTVGQSELQLEEPAQ